MKTSRVLQYETLCVLAKLARHIANGGDPSEFIRKLVDGAVTSGGFGKDKKEEILQLLKDKE